MDEIVGGVGASSISVKASIEISQISPKTKLFHFNANFAANFFSHLHDRYRNPHTLHLYSSYIAELFDYVSVASHRDFQVAEYIDTHVNYLNNLWTAEFLSQDHRNWKLFLCLIDFHLDREPLNFAGLNLIDLRNVARFPDVEGSINRSIRNVEH